MNDREYIVHVIHALADADARRAHRHIPRGATMSEIRRWEPADGAYDPPGMVLFDVGGRYVLYADVVARDADHAAEVARLTAPKLPAAAYFDLRGAEDGLDDAICRAFGCDPGDSDAWPFVDMWYDSYDGSFELAAKDVAWRPSMDKWNAALALGFQRGWINFADGTELYCVVGASAPSFGKAVWPRHGTPGERALLVVNRRLGAEVARLREENERLRDAKIENVSEIMSHTIRNERRMALAAVRARVAEFDPTSKGFDADEIYVILDEVWNDTHTTQ